MYIYIYLIKGERDRVGQIIFCCNKKRKRRSSLITGQTLLRTPEWYFSKLDKPIKISDISAEWFVSKLDKPIKISDISAKWFVSKLDKPMKISDISAERYVSKLDKPIFLLKGMSLNQLRFLIFLKLSTQIFY